MKTSGISVELAKYVTMYMDRKVILILALNQRAMLAVKHAEITAMGSPHAPLSIAHDQLTTLALKPGE
jgi:hypothetical protein